jgi:peroxiredoxin
VEAHSLFGRVSLAALIAITSPGQLRSQAPGSRAPDFALRTLRGDTAALSSYRGHAVLLNFWATWCKPCRQEMADLIAAYAAHRAQGLEILAINLADQERVRAVRQYADEVRMPFAILLDTRGEVRGRYAVLSVPTSVFIDTLGVIRVVHPGPITNEALRRGLAEILPPS